MWKKIMIGAAVGAVAVIILAAAIIYRGGGFDRFINAKSAEVTQEVEVKYTDLQVADKMHDMANGLIVPGDGKRWNTIDMDKKNIADVQKMLENSEDFDEKDELLQIINAWSQGDFTNIVDDHNFVWNMLDGNVGEASGINEEKVNEAVESFK